MIITESNDSICVEPPPLNTIPLNQGTLSGKELFSGNSFVGEVWLVLGETQVKFLFAGLLRAFKC